MSTEKRTASLEQTKKNTSTKLFFQPKLTVNQPNDLYEQEADAVADKVMRMPDSSSHFFQPSPQLIQRKCSACEQEEKLQRKESDEDDEMVQTKSISNTIQRKCAHCEEEEKKVQRKETPFAGNAEAPSSVDRTISQRGQPLDADTRSFMESRFNYDFETVQIHNDALAHESSAEIQARAYTHQNHVVFGRGQYQPDSYSGKQLLAHELAHVVQQDGGGGQPAVSKKMVQRVSLFYWEPFYSNGTEEHKDILNDISAQHSALVIEAPIPNGKRDVYGSSSDHGFGKKGYADMYDGDGIIGLYFESRGVPEKLPRRGTKKGGVTYSGKIAPVVKEISNNKFVKNGKDGAKNISIGDLKPINSLPASHGPKQLDDYEAGIDLAADQVKTYFPDEKWDPGKVRRISTGTLKALIPPKYREDSADPIIKDAVLKNQSGLLKIPKKSYEKVKARLVAKETGKDGILGYAWVPIQPKTLEELPPEIARLPKEITEFIIDPLKEPVVKQKDTGGATRKKNLPGAGNEAPVVNKKATGKLLQKAPTTTHPFELKTWQANRKRIASEYKKVQGSAGVKDAEMKANSMDAAMKLQQEMGIRAPNYTEKQLTLSADLKKIHFWTNPLTGIFGPLKQLFGSVFTFFVNGYDSVKKWVKDIARKLTFKGAGGGLIGASIKAAFNVLKVVARIVVNDVIQLLKEDIQRGIQRKIDLLLEELDIESKIKEIKSYFAPLESAIKAIETWVKETIAKYQSFFDAIHTVMTAIGNITKVINAVKWAARAVACFSPPLVGCLWNLAMEALEAAAAWVVETCWFRKKIAPYVLEHNYVHTLGKDLYGSLKSHTIEYFPALKDFLVSDKEAPGRKISPSELECGTGEGGEGEGTGKDVSDEAEAIMNLQQELGEKKFNALVELLQKAKVGENKKMTVDQINQLREAMKGYSVDDIKKMAENFRKGDTKSIPEDIKKKLQDLAAAPTGQQQSENLDPAQKEKEVQAIEEQKDAAEALKDAGVENPKELAKASTNPALFVLDLIFMDKVNGPFTRKNNKLQINEKAVKAFERNGIAIFSLGIETTFKMNAAITDMPGGGKNLQKVSVSLELIVYKSKNPVLPVGSMHKLTRVVIYDPETDAHSVLRGYPVIEQLVTKVLSEEKNLTGKIYNFNDAFKAKLLRFVHEGSLIKFYFETTEVMQEGPGIVDQETQQFKLIKPGTTFTAIASKE